MVSCEELITWRKTFDFWVEMVSTQLAMPFCEWTTFLEALHLKCQWLFQRAPKECSGCIPNGSR